LARFKVHHQIPFLNRLYHDRNRARGERDRYQAELTAQQDRHQAELSAERDRYRSELAAQRDRHQAELSAKRVRYEAELSEERARHQTERDSLATEARRPRPADSELTHVEPPPAPFGRTEAPADVDDHELVSRIVAAYRASTAISSKPSQSMWEAIGEKKGDVHETLAHGQIEDVQRLLRDPGKTDLFYGFESLARSLNTGRPGMEPHSVWIYQHLLVLAEATGVKRRWNPEGAATAFPLPSIDKLLALIDQGVGHRVEFPNPFPGEVGLATSRGIISFRAIQAIYQAWRVYNLAKGNIDARIVEVGAGLGRTAFYAAKFGLRNYTIVDIPLTSVAQGYFLGRTLGPDAISLFKEERSGIAILPPSAFLNSDDKYDVVLNADSLTELDPETASAYCAAFRDRANIFLSINHEINPFTVHELYAAIARPAVSRAPYWLRAGYVEEIFVNK
jgi:hypothetical protein